MSRKPRPKEKKPRRREFLFVVGLLALAGPFAVWRWWPRAAAPPEGSERAASPQDPRLTFATPYRNVRPDVKYVGDDACARCHPVAAQSYRRHPMSNSLAPIASSTPVERYDAAAKNPFDAQGFHYQVERRGERVIHRETATDAQGQLITELDSDVQFAVGSGTRGRTYLVNHDGYLFQSPITWFPQKGAWDLSPGFDQLHHHFGRPVPADCLFCHSNRAAEVPDTQNQYRPPIFAGYAIGCERCHGPGELHVRRHEAKEKVEGVDDTIVNPIRLEPALREAVCQQCHLQGIVRVLRRGRQAFDYRPGLPLHLFLAIYVKPPSADHANKFVGQVEQMTASKCFRASKGALGCLSCHDPHDYPAPAERVAYYRQRCLQCHDSEIRNPKSEIRNPKCSEPLAKRLQTSKDDNCVQCHMPAGESDIQHHSITDHRVPRRPLESAPAPAALREGEMPMRLFHRDLVDSNDWEVGRDLGIALMDRVERYPPRVRRALAQLALPRLDAAVKADPDDATAWDARAHALWAEGDDKGAAAAFDHALDLAPRREITLQWATALALVSKRPDRAVSYLERALEVNPWRHEFHYYLAEAQAMRGVWPAVGVESQAALKLNPANLAARRLLVAYYLKVGQADAARAEFDRLLGLHPPNEADLRRWFAQQAR